MILLVLVAAFIGSDVFGCHDDDPNPPPGMGRSLPKTHQLLSKSFKPVQFRQLMFNPDCKNVIQWMLGPTGPYANLNFPFDGNPEQVISVRAQAIVPRDTPIEPLGMVLVSGGPMGGLLMTRLDLPIMNTPQITGIDINGASFCQIYEPPPVAPYGYTLATINQSFRFHFYK